MRFCSLLGLSPNLHLLHLANALSQLSSSGLWALCRWQSGLRKGIQTTKGSLELAIPNDGSWFQVSSRDSRVDVSAHTILARAALRNHVCSREHEYPTWVPACYPCPRTARLAHESQSASNRHRVREHCNSCARLPGCKHECLISNTTTKGTAVTLERSKVV